MKTSLRKNILAAAMLVSAAAAPSVHAVNTAAADGNYVINVALDGRVFRFNGDTLELKTSTAGGVKTLQRMPVAKSDSLLTAVFKGSVKGNAVAYITFADDTHFAVPFILEEGVTRVYSKKAQKFSYVAVDGTPLNDKNNTYTAEVIAAGSAFDGKIEMLKADKTLTEVQRGQQYADILEGKSKAQEAVTEKFIRTNSGNSLGALLYLGSYEIKNNNLELSERYWKILSPANQNIKEVADRHARAVAFNTVKEGDMFRDFTLKEGTVDGKEAKLSDYVGKGKYVLVDFWASWCGACRMGIPNVKAAYEACKGDNFDCLSITVWDKRAKSLQAIKEEAMPWTQLIDEEGLSGRTYGISAIPRVMLFSPDGHIMKLDIRRDEIVTTVTTAVKGK